MAKQTITVSSAGGLKAALAAATGGETIVLAAGNYGKLEIFHKSFDAAVTIKGGTFSSVVLNDVKGMTLDSATVYYTPDATTNSNSQAIRVYNSGNILITHSTVTGGNAINGVPVSATKLDATGNVIGLPAGKGINVDNSSNVTINDTNISHFAKGVTFYKVTNIAVTNNQIHDLRTTPISGSAVSGVVITGNHTWDSTPWRFGLNGDHGDRIHIWTGTAAMTGVVISNNLLEQGKGSPLLGIYLDDNGKHLGFPNAVIADNTIKDSNGQGVRLENVTGQVTHNTLIWSGTGDLAHNAPRFQITANTHNVVFTNNTGNVAIEPGVHDLNFIGQVGTFVTRGMTAADIASIHGIPGHLAQAAAAGDIITAAAAAVPAAHTAPAAGAADPNAAVAIHAVAPVTESAAGFTLDNGGIVLPHSVAVTAATPPVAAPDGLAAALSTSSGEIDLAAIAVLHAGPATTTPLEAVVDLGAFAAPASGGDQGLFGHFAIAIDTAHVLPQIA